MSIHDGVGGRYLRQVPRTVPHHCNPPHDDGAVPPWDHDMWLCDCGRLYVWSDAAGYGFGWRRVWFRYWLYRLFHRGA